MRFSMRAYRLLLKLYPAGFRERYAVPLERQFKDDYADVTGRGGLARLWGRTLLDLARSLPGQLAREIGQDARHAFRVWRRSPVQALSVFSVLAIAVGANTGVYSILDALLLRSLPFAEPHRLASLDLAPVPMTNAGTFDEWRQQSPYLAAGAVYTSFEANVEVGRERGRARVTETSATFFSVLGRQPIVGRAFGPVDDTPGGALVAIIGHGLWLQQFAGDPRAVGSSVRVNGVPLTIIGVAPPGFDYPEKTHIWSPSVWEYPRIPKTGVTFRFVIGRLRPEITWGQARQMFDTETRSRETLGAPSRGRPPALTPLQESLAGPVRQASWVLMAGTALLLLLACANIANIMLARTLARANELKIRLALGASRARLVQQLVTETMLLSALAGIAGLLVAWWSTRLAALVQPPSLASQVYDVLDWRVLGFAATMALMTGLMFGVGPAFSATRNRMVASSATATRPIGHRRITGLLVAGQVTITIVLLTGSVALGRTFVGLLRVDPGFDVGSLVSVNVSFAGTDYDDRARVQGYFLEVIRRLKDVPGVSSASATEYLPLATGGYMGDRFTIDNTGPETLTTVVPVAPEYFRTLGTRLLAGREFTTADLTSGESIVMVNEELARAFGSAASAVGRRLTSRSTRVIVGVVQGIRAHGPTYHPEPQAFIVSRSPSSLTFVARVNGAPRDHVARIRDAVASVDPKLPVFDVKTMEERLDETLARPRVYSTSVAFFGGLALILAIVGVHGAVSHAVAHRTREMAIRLALGTTPARLRRGLLGQTLAWVLLGAIPGIAMAMLSGDYVRNLIRGADASLAATCAVAAVMTLTIASLASWRASHRLRALEIASILRVETGD